MENEEQRAEGQSCERKGSKETSFMHCTTRRNIYIVVGALIVFAIVLMILLPRMTNA